MKNIICCLVLVILVSCGNNQNPLKTSKKSTISADASKVDLSYKCDDCNESIGIIYDSKNLCAGVVAGDNVSRVTTSKSCLDMLEIDKVKIKFPNQESFEVKNITYKNEFAYVDSGEDLSQFKLNSPRLFADFLSVSIVSLEVINNIVEQKIFNKCEITLSSNLYKSSHSVNSLILPIKNCTKIKRGSVILQGSDLVSITDKEESLVSSLSLVCKDNCLTDELSEIEFVKSQISKKLGDDYLGSVFSNEEDENLLYKNYFNFTENIFEFKRDLLRIDNGYPIYELGDAMAIRIKYKLNYNQYGELEKLEEIQNRILKYTRVSSEDLVRFRNYFPDVQPLTMSSVLLVEPKDLPELNSGILNFDNYFEIATLNAFTLMGISLGDFQVETF